MKRANFPLFTELTTQSIINRPQVTDPITDYQSFINELIRIADIAIPKTKRKSKIKTVPYWTNTCKQAIIKRNRLL